MTWIWLKFLSITAATQPYYSPVQPYYSPCSPTFYLCPSAFANMTGHIINFFFFSLQIWIESNENRFVVNIYHQWSGDVPINTQCARHYDNCFMNGPWMLYKFYCRFRFDQWLYGISFYNLEYEVFSKNVYGCIAMFYIMYSRILYKEIYLAFFFLDFSWL